MLKLPEVMKMKAKRNAVLLALFFSCALMALVDGVWMPAYWVKSLFKVCLFSVLPVIYVAFNKEVSLRELFRANKKGMKLALCLSVPLYILIVGAYLLLKDVFDFSAVTGALTGNIGVSKENFLYVALYISFVNSFLEEFFFRGFSFFTLKKYASRKTAYIISAFFFALYHIAIMTGWFSVGVFIITVSGLFLGGLIFNYLNEKSGNIYPSWLLHMSANFAINTIGFMLFGII